MAPWNNLCTLLLFKLLQENVQPKQRRTDAPLPDNGLYQCQELLMNSIREVKFIYCFNFIPFIEL
jgi:hypothetical protein